MAIDNLRTNGTDKAIRKDAIVLRSFIVQVDPRYCYPELERDHWSQNDINTPEKYRKRGELDMNRVSNFWNTFRDYAMKKWGDRIISIDLHCDETTPHIHINLVPVLDDGRLCNKELISGGRKGAVNFVTEIGNIGRQIGLERAHEMTEDELAEHNGRHRSPTAIQNQIDLENERHLELLQRENDKLQQSIEFAASAKHEIPEPFSRKLPEPEYEKTLFGTKETEESMEHREAAEKQRNDDRWKWIKDATASLTTLRKNHDSLSEKISTLEHEKSQLQQQLRQTQLELKERTYSYNELREIACEARKSISLHKILIDNGYALDMKESSKAEYGVKQYRNSEGRKVGVTGNLFIDNHDTSFKGAGPIDLQMCIDHGHTDNSYFTEAVGRLADMYGITPTTHAVMSHPQIREVPRVREAINDAARDAVSMAPRPTYEMPNRGDKSKTAQALLWCIHRGITSETFNHLVNTNQIYIDFRGNIVFPRINGGYFGRGTYGNDNNFKQTIGKLDAGAAYIHGPDASVKSALILCECITDALALIQQHPSANIAVIGGNMRPNIERKPDQKIILAFDNDDGGHQHNQFYREIYTDAIDMYPPIGKDWSEWVQNHEQWERERRELDERLQEERRIAKERLIEEQRALDGPNIG